MAKAFQIYCHHCKRKVWPVKSLLMHCCPRCGTEFLPSQIKQAKDAALDTLMADSEDTPMESYTR